jgi:hypothetical protein
MCNEGSSVADWRFPQQSFWRFSFLCIVTLCRCVSTSRLFLHLQCQVIRITFTFTGLLSSGNILCCSVRGFRLKCPFKTL